MVDRSQLEAALAEFRPLLTNDGGDIVLEDIDATTGTAALRLVIGPTACEECIIEPQMLHAILREFIADKAVPGLRDVTVIDPRLAGENA